MRWSRVEHRTSRNSEKKETNRRSSDTNPVQLRKSRKELSRTLDTGLEVDADDADAAAANARKSSSRRSLVPQADWRKREELFPEPPGDDDAA
jgi:hypothetical protein